MCGLNASLSYIEQAVLCTIQINHLQLPTGHSMQVHAAFDFDVTAKQAVKDAARLPSNEHSHKPKHTVDVCLLTH